MVITPLFTMRKDLISTDPETPPDPPDFLPNQIETEASVGNPEHQPPGKPQRGPSLTKRYLHVRCPQQAAQGYIAKLIHAEKRVNIAQFLFRRKVRVASESRNRAEEEGSGMMTWLRSVRVMRSCAPSKPELF